MRKIYEEKRPWGRFLQFTQDEKSTVKILEVNPGEILSLQSHKHRFEFWFVLEGNPTFVLDGSKRKYQSGDVAYVKKGMKHRIGNSTKKKARILEISTGKFDEKDIIRYEDKYHRVKE